MRCHEARKRLSSLTSGEIDGRLERHLQDCPACARVAAARKTLARDLKDARADDLDGGLSLAEMRTRVESMAASQRATRKETTTMAAFFNTFRKRPRFGVSIAIAVAVLAFVTLVPFRFEQTVGYEVAVAGVNPSLAMDGDKIETLLTRLGVGDAEYHVLGCDTTCNLKISRLKSEGDVKLVLAAFDRIGNVEIEAVSTLEGEEGSSLLKHAIWEIKVSDDVSPDDEARQIVVERIGDLCDSMGQFNIWISNDSVTGMVGSNVSLHEIGNHKAMFIQTDGQTDGAKECEVVEIVKQDDGTSEIVFTDVDGVEHRFDPSDPEAVQKLRDAGMNVEITDLDDGMIMVKVNQSTGEATSNPDQSAAPKAGDGSLPEHYSLSQNYPNPFNPTTNISFSLPKSEHVTLEVYNIQGQKVRTLIDHTLAAGEHIVTWDATTDEGQPVASGVYLYRLTAGDYVESKKMNFVK